MDPVATTLVILGLAILAFVSNRVPLGVVAIGVSLALWATGLLGLDEALAGFGDPTVVFIATLFVVGEALDSTGVTAWAGQQVIARGGRDRRSLLAVIGILVAVLTALISVNGAVAALLPVVVVVAARAGIAPSQMLMPLAFSAHAGSMLALTGTPVNIIVSEAAADAGERRFGFFEFALVGVPLLLGSLAIILLVGRRLLPTRIPSALPQDLADLTATLRAQYALPTDTELVTVERGVTEVMVPPRSPLIGTHLFPGMATPSGDLVVLAVQRSGEDLTAPDDTLRAGDILVLSGSWERLQHHTARDEVLVVDDPATLRRGVPLGVGARRTLVILVGMILLLATGLVPAAVAGLLAAVAIVLTGVLTPNEAYRSVSWTTVVLVGGMIPLSTAFVSTGTADAIADALLGVVGSGSAHVALLAICVLTVLLSQLISNTATVLIMVPIAIVVATDLEVSVLPFLMALAVCGAASFLTPVATAANTMVMEPGGYRFGDYWKLGLPLLLLSLALAVFYVPLVWSF
ncbi:SLC13/DASS family transporter [Nostocoides sp. F2B08]|uniref:SLC13 family permease n=1 Tax=Nostocoides sp. F2B08 TaxID=2653936 RepID=UPI001262D134|nr:SLC13 family permease [Tetrasphaera sp. F2B08]KAB7745251.1 SLC13/DASS family transporter [Tetrasphaera sp. F2B08]